MVVCCVKKCKNSNKKGFKGAVTFHRFPSNARLREEWLKAVKMTEHSLTKHSRVCSEHFLPSCLPAVTEKRTRLKSNARPTENLPSILQEGDCSDVSPVLPCEQVNVPDYTPMHSNHQVCRACLAIGIHMQDIKHISADGALSMILGQQANSEAGLPSGVCFECTAYLRKLRTFARKAQRANSLLVQLLRSDGEIQESSVREIDRAKNRLTSSLKTHRLPEINIDSEYVSDDRPAGKCESDDTDDGHDVDTFGFEDVETKASPYLSVEIEIKKEVAEYETSALDLDAGLVPGEQETATNVGEDGKPKGGSRSLKAVRKKKQPKKKIKSAAEKRYEDSEESDTNSGDASSSSREARPRRRRRRTDAARRYKNYQNDYEAFATVTVMSDQERLELFHERGQRKWYLESRHRCVDCYLGFSSQQAYDKHRRKHQPSAGDYECDICKLRMKNERQLVKHISMNHRNKFVCKRCLHVCSNAERARHHEATHTMSTHRCEECNQTFTLLLTYKKHMYHKHPPETPCAACGATYLGRAALRAHAALRHADLADEAVAAAAAACSDCGVEFYSDAALRRHLDTSARHNAPAARLSCEVCEEHFPDRTSALAHRATHRDSRVEQVTRAEIPCEQCDEVLEDSRAYHAHFRRSHPDKTRTHYPAMRAPCMCELCGKVFQSKVQLRTHTHRHTGERPYKCDICNKAFVLEAMRKIHMRTHTKELPYKCDKCTQAFSNYSNMRRHKAVHTDVKPYSCDICNKSFKYRSTANDHIQYVHLKKPWPKRDRSKRSKPPPPPADPAAPHPGPLPQ